MQNETNTKVRLTCYGNSQLKNSTKLTTTSITTTTTTSTSTSTTSPTTIITSTNFSTISTNFNNSTIPFQQSTSQSITASLNQTKYLDVVNSTILIKTESSLIMKNTSR